MEVFSARLKWLRENKGYTQKEMAEKLGLSQQYYGRFEKNKGQPNLDTLSKLPSILGESVDFMLGVTDFDRDLDNKQRQLNECIASITSISERLAKGYEYEEKVKMDDEQKEKVKFQIDFLREELNKFKETFNNNKEIIINRLQDIPMISQESLELIEKFKYPN